MMRRNVLGLPVRDCRGREIGRIVDTWPDDGSWEADLLVVRLSRFGGRRMLPVEDVAVIGRVAIAAYSRAQVDDAPAMDGGRHGADDPYRAQAYWMFEEAAMFSAPWRPRSGSSATGRPSPTSPSPTPTAS